MDLKIYESVYLYPDLYLIIFIYVYIYMNMNISIYSTYIYICILGQTGSKFGLKVYDSFNMFPNSFQRAVNAFEEIFQGCYSICLRRTQWVSTYRVHSNLAIVLVVACTQLHAL